MNNIKQLFLQIKSQSEKYFEHNSGNFRLNMSSYLWRYISSLNLIHYFQPFCFLNNSNNDYSFSRNLKIEHITRLFMFDYNLKISLQQIIIDVELMLKVSLLDEIRSSLSLSYNVDLQLEELKNTYVNVLFRQNMTKEKMHKLKIFTPRDNNISTLSEYMNRVSFGDLLYIFASLKDEIQINIIKKYYPYFYSKLRENNVYTEEKIKFYFINIYNKIVKLRNSINHLESIFDFQWKKAFDFKIKEPNSNGYFFEANLTSQGNNFTLVQDMTVKILGTTLNSLNEMKSLFYDKISISIQNNNVVNFNVLELFSIIFIMKEYNIWKNETFSRLSTEPNSILKKLIPNFPAREYWLKHLLVKYNSILDSTISQTYGIDNTKFIKDFSNAYEFKNKNFEYIKLKLSGLISKLNELDNENVIIKNLLDKLFNNL